MVLFHLKCTWMPRLLENFELFTKAFYEGYNDENIPVVGASV